MGYPDSFDGVKNERKMVVAGVSALVSAALAAPALAEGSWTGYWSRVLTDKDTRTWTDNNGDAQGTYVKFRYCTYAPGAPYTLKNIQAQLTREDTWTPDENMGTVVYSCNTSVWQSYNYGRVGAGKFHVTLLRVNGSTRAPAYVNVGSSSTHGIAINY